ncbi:ATP-binding protein [Streptomyces sp. NPDC051738]|uniref:ATP-binding protein n=1 Tax=Streptomyces sp. NPDC051738 TaxID=3365672 RepID=UPI0037CFABD4
MNVQPQHPHTREAFYRRDRRSVRLAREFTHATLTDWAATARTDDVLLCVSELTTNALLHGVPPGRGLLLRLVRHLDEVIRVEVHDSGPGRLRFGDPSPESEHGRGLLLVTLLADKWGVEDRDPGKAVWCEFAPEGDAAPSRSAEDRALTEY